MKHGSWADILLLSTYYTHTHTHAVPRPSVKKHTCVNQYEKAQHTITQTADYTIFTATELATCTLFLNTGGLQADQ